MNAVSEHARLPATAYANEHATYDDEHRVLQREGRIADLRDKLL